MEQRLRLPAEWEPHTACWLAFPYLRDEWPNNLAEAQASIAALCRAIAEPGDEPVRLLVRTQELETLARSLIGEVPDVRYVRADYGDCWLRDTAPLFGHRDDGALGALCFEFNGWGGKYEIPFDAGVSGWLTERLDAARFDSSLVLEGGALDSNGQGTFLTTAACALNPNRNEGLTREAFEKALGELVSIDRLIWIEAGLDHDHTDGHIDMIARFVAPDTAICMKSNPAAPNAEVLESIEQGLRRAGLNVLTIPAPPALHAPNGEPLPASYCNFYIANSAVIVPTYGEPEDHAALAEIANAFPGREVVGLPAADLLWGGGAFHCVTQAQPSTP